MIKITAVVNRQLVGRIKRFSTVKTEEWSLFPRQREGNIYSVNWSLCEDRVTPVGGAFRNARVALLKSKLVYKTGSNKVDTEMTYFGDFKITESGDTISHDEFKQLFDIQKRHFESGIALYVEDGSLGSSNKNRHGVRVISDDVAVAFVARTLLIPSPVCTDVNHRARFNGWNFDPRWVENKPVWNGSYYDLPDKIPKISKNGDRPIVAFVSSSIKAASVQFAENKGEIVGASVLLGTSVPIRVMIDAIGLASTVLVNQNKSEALAMACTSLVKGKDTAIIINADDSIVDAAVESGLLYGAYHNTLSPIGVSAMWNGYIGKSIDLAMDTYCNALPIPQNGISAVPTEPYNLVFPAKHIIFYEKGAKKSKLSIDEALQKIVNLTDDSKTEAIKSILKNATISIIGNSSDIASIF